MDRKNSIIWYKNSIIFLLLLLGLNIFLLREKLLVERIIFIRKVSIVFRKIFILKFVPWILYFVIPFLLSRSIVYCLL